MQFVPTDLPGVWILEPERHADERGYFARTWCCKEAIQNGIKKDFVQCSVSFNHQRGTLRGMHYQKAPHDESKLVRCTRGAIFDVVVDVRPHSKTFGQWEGFSLTEENGRALFIPEGFAHGFQTLAANTEVYYQISEYFHPESSAGIHHADADVGIEWPLEVTCISEKDQHLGCIDAIRHEVVHD